MRAKAFLITIGGLLVCSAILSSFTWILVQSYAHGPRLEPADFIGGAVFGGLSLLVLGISLRASAREWKQPKEGGGRGLLAKAAPVLVLAGLGLGVAFGLKLDADRADTRQWYASRACEVRVVWGLDEAACRVRAEQCVDTLFRADPPMEATLQPLQAGFLAELGKANQAERQGEAGAAERVQALTRLVSDFNDRGWQARYRQGVVACVGEGQGARAQP